MLAVVTQFAFTRKLRKATKERIQMFEGVVIRTGNKESHTSRITVRKIASGVGVEKSFLMHSPLIEKIEIVRRAKVRRKFLSSFVSVAVSQLAWRLSNSIALLLMTFMTLRQKRKLNAWRKKLLRLLLQNKLKKMPLRLNLTLRLLKLQLAIKTRNCQLVNH